MQSEHVVVYRIADDAEAERVAGVLEALGYVVRREFDEGDAGNHLHWAAARIARRHRLTERERETLELVLAGHTNATIRRSLRLCKETVKWHMHNIFVKTDTDDREDLVRLALQLPKVRPRP